MQQRFRAWLRERAEKSKQADEAKKAKSAAAATSTATDSVSADTGTSKEAKSDAEPAAASAAAATSSPPPPQAASASPPAATITMTAAERHALLLSILSAPDAFASLLRAMNTQQQQELLFVCEVNQLLDIAEAQKKANAVLTGADASMLSLPPLAAPSPASSLTAALTDLQPLYLQAIKIANVFLRNPESEEALAFADKASPPPVSASSSADSGRTGSSGGKGDAAGAGDGSTPVDETMLHIPSLQPATRRQLLRCIPLSVPPQGIANGEAAATSSASSPPSSASRYDIAMMLVMFEAAREQVEAALAQPVESWRRKMLAAHAATAGAAVPAVDGAADGVDNAQSPLASPTSPSLQMLVLHDTVSPTAATPLSSAALGSPGVKLTLPSVSVFPSSTTSAVGLPSVTPATATTTGGVKSYAADYSFDDILPAVNPLRMKMEMDAVMQWWVLHADSNRNNSDGVSADEVDNNNSTAVVRRRRSSAGSVHDSASPPNSVTPFPAAVITPLPRAPSLHQLSSSSPFSLPPPPLTLSYNGYGYVFRSFFLFLLSQGHRHTALFMWLSLHSAVATMKGSDVDREAVRMNKAFNQPPQTRKADDSETSAAPTATPSASSSSSSLSSSSLLNTSTLSFVELVSLFNLLEDAHAQLFATGDSSAAAAETTAALAAAKKRRDGFAALLGTNLLVLDGDADAEADSAHDGDGAASAGEGRNAASAASLAPLSDIDRLRLLLLGDDATAPLRQLTDAAPAAATQQSSSLLLSSASTALRALLAALYSRLSPLCAKLERLLRLQLWPQYCRSAATFESKVAIRRKPRRRTSIVAVRPADGRVTTTGGSGGGVDDNSSISRAASASLSTSAAASAAVATTNADALSVEQASLLQPPFSPLTTAPSAPSSPAAPMAALSAPSTPAAFSAPSLPSSPLADATATPTLFVSTASPTAAAEASCTVKNADELTSSTASASPALPPQRSLATSTSASTVPSSSRPRTSTTSSSSSSSSSQLLRELKGSKEMRQWLIVQAKRGEDSVIEAARAGTNVTVAAAEPNAVNTKENAAATATSNTPEQTVIDSVVLYRCQPRLPQRATVDPLSSTAAAAVSLSDADGWQLITPSGGTAAASKSTESSDHSDAGVYHASHHKQQRRHSLSHSHHHASGTISKHAHASTPRKQTAPASAVLASRVLSKVSEGSSGNSNNRHNSDHGGDHNNRVRCVLHYPSTGAPPAHLDALCFPTRAVHSRDSDSKLNNHDDDDAGCICDATLAATMSFDSNSSRKAVTINHHIAVAQDGSGKVVTIVDEQPSSRNGDSDQHQQPHATKLLSASLNALWNFTLSSTNANSATSTSSTAAQSTLYCCALRFSQYETVEEQWYETVTAKYGDSEDTAPSSVAADGHTTAANDANANGAATADGKAQPAADVPIAKPVALPPLSSTSAAATTKGSSRSGVFGQLFDDVIDDVRSVVNRVQSNSNNSLLSPSKPSSSATAQPSSTTAAATTRSKSFTFADLFSPKTSATAAAATAQARNAGTGAGSENKIDNEATTATKSSGDDVTAFDSVVPSSSTDASTSELRVGSAPISTSSPVQSLASIYSAMAKESEDSESKTTAIGVEDVVPTLTSTPSPAPSLAAPAAVSTSADPAAAAAAAAAMAAAATRIASPALAVIGSRRSSLSSSSGASGSSGNIAGLANGSIAAATASFTPITTSPLASAALVAAASSSFAASNAAVLPSQPTSVVYKHHRLSTVRTDYVLVVLSRMPLFNILRAALATIAASAVGGDERERTVMRSGSQGGFVFAAAGKQSVDPAHVMSAVRAAVASALSLSSPSPSASLLNRVLQSRSFIRLCMLSYTPTSALPMLLGCAAASLPQLVPDNVTKLTLRDDAEAVTAASIASIFERWSPSILSASISSGSNGVVDYSVHALLRTFHPLRLLLLIEAVMSERRIIILSRSHSRLVLIQQVLWQMIYPFTWCYLSIPLLPLSLFRFLQCPTPFIIGVHACHRKQAVEAASGQSQSGSGGDSASGAASPSSASTAADDIVFVDIDHDEVLLPSTSASSAADPSTPHHRATPASTSNAATMHTSDDDGSSSSASGASSGVIQPHNPHFHFPSSMRGILLHHLSVLFSSEIAAQAARGGILPVREASMTTAEETAINVEMSSEVQSPMPTTPPGISATAATAATVAVIGNAAVDLFGAAELSATVPAVALQASSASSAASDGVALASSLPADRTSSFHLLFMRCWAHLLKGWRRFVLVVDGDSGLPTAATSVLVEHMAMQVASDGTRSGTRDSNKPAAVAGLDGMLLIHPASSLSSSSSPPLLLFDAPSFIASKPPHYRGALHTLINSSFFPLFIRDRAWATKLVGNAGAGGGSAAVAGGGLTSITRDLFDRIESGLTGERVAVYWHARACMRQLEAIRHKQSQKQQQQSSLNELIDSAQTQLLQWLASCYHSRADVSLTDLHRYVNMSAERNMSWSDIMASFAGDDDAATHIDAAATQLPSPLSSSALSSVPLSSFATFSPSAVAVDTSSVPSTPLIHSKPNMQLLDPTTPSTAANVNTDASATGSTVPAAATAQPATSAADVSAAAHRASGSDVKPTSDQLPSLPSFPVNGVQASDEVVALPPRHRRHSGSRNSSGTITRTGRRRQSSSSSQPSSATGSREVSAERTAADTSAVAKRAAIAAALDSLASTTDLSATAASSAAASNAALHIPVSLSLATSDAEELP